MLFFIEIIQFQEYLVQHDLKKEINVESLRIAKMGEIQFAENIPISEIIARKFDATSEDEMFGFKMKAYKIYKKYIEVGSQFEINISSLERSKHAYIANLAAFLKLNSNINDLFMMYQDCKEAMRLLLMYSLSRFKSSIVFEEIEQIFHPSSPQQIVIEELP